MVQKYPQIVRNAGYNRLGSQMVQKPFNQRFCKNAAHVRRMYLSLQVCTQVAAQ